MQASDAFFDGSERRQSSRVTIDADLYIELESAMPGDDTPANIVKCEALDVSSGGLQAKVSCKLVDSSIHTLVLDTHNDDAVYKLTVEVMWVKPIEAGCYAGLKIYDCDSTEAESWQSAFQKLLN